MTAQWYVLRVVSGFEAKVKDLILDALKASSVCSEAVEAVEVFFEDKAAVRFGRKVNVQSSMMPGYVMIKMELSPELVNLIRTRRHVVGFLGSSGDHPVPVDDTELAKLRATIVKTIGDNSVVFSVGESVRIVDGPFASFTGVVDEVDDKKRRIKVAVAILGRQMPVVLEYEQVDKIDRDE